ncbi:ATP-binding protein [Parvibaculum sp.]|jgi:PAS domain S-box-containing protein|uniref:ATP-binding protein n=2 Tax=Parvibaculum sp. TaxID=2024848 RepID=UPI001B077819|nr:ATP-binding protein [Parvibaculum sp.]MBO6633891.1 response regulator [Parvibaculum sp.]MBO6677901.1 response regulator [Parvibaculum sp.]MBO6904599.1 response regulator [Parvibaculum sp.]
MFTAIAMIESTAVIVLALLMLALVGDRLARSFWFGSIVYGVIFAGAGVISMASPVELQPGFYVDARSVVMALSGVIAGPVGVLVTGAALSAMRYSFGGEGMVGGIVSLWLVAIPAVLMWVWLRYRERSPVQYRHIVILAATASLMPLFSIYIYLWEQDAALSIQIAQTVVPTTFFGVLVLGVLVVGDMQRRWALSAHAEGRAQLQAIAANAPSILFQFYLREDGIAQFLYVSEGVRRMLGISPEEIIEKPGAIGQMLPSSGLMLFRERVRESARHMTPWTLDMEFTLPDGRAVWMRGAAAPRVGIEGRIVWDGSLVDITEQKQTESLKAEFVSTVSHELRTPLTSIRGSLGLVVGGAAGELPEKAKGLLRIALSNCERLVRLINDILDIEKIESGRMQFDVKEQPLYPLVESAIDAGRDYLSDRNISFSLEDGAPGAVVSVDADRMHQVMTNLLSNAVKFSPPGGKVSVRIRRTPNGFLRVSVRDRGPGIPEEFRSRVFGRFEQADGSDTRAQDGTGLGLNITKAIVERFDGRISFDSEPGIGTVFHVDLPEVAAPRDIGLVPQTGGTSAHRPCGERVLVVEDDEDAANILCNLLGEEGIDCDIALDMASAKALLARNRYMAITLDIRLGADSGLWLLQDLRSSDRQRPPVIVISGYVNETRLTLNGSAVGIVDWLDKPVDVVRLRSAVEKVRSLRHTEMPSILHIEDDEDVLQVMAIALGSEVEVAFARTFSEAREQLFDRTFDVVILDLDLPDGWGADLLAFIPSTTAVIVFSASEIEGVLAEKVEAALTKTRMSEIAIADIVRNITAGRNLPAVEERETETGEVQ